MYVYILTLKRHKIYLDPIYLAIVVTKKPKDNKSAIYKFFFKMVSSFDFYDFIARIDLYLDDIEPS